MARKLSTILLFFVSFLFGCAPPTALPAPSATGTPLATATPDLTSGPIAPYPGNPVFTVGPAGAWDSGTVFNPRVVIQDGTYHMFYSGSTDATLPTLAIGYAVSNDGRTFTRQAAEPIMAGDGRGFDARQVSSGVPLLAGEQWVLYYSAGGGPGPGKAIGRAVAPTPTGPWERSSQPILLVGESGEWDAAYVVPESVLIADGGYVMYYTAGSTWPEGTAMIGMATSPDGITWKKHSGPVLQPGAEGAWDSAGVWGCTVLKTETGWEMFYTGGDGTTVGIGYATSADGVNWHKFEGNPILSPADDPALTTPILQSPSAVKHSGGYLVYYDYGVSGGGIGLAMGSKP